MASSSPASLAWACSGEAGGLVLGVVEFGEAVGDFAADDEEFEALGDFRVAVGGAGQRRLPPGSR